MLILKPVTYVKSIRKLYIYIYNFIRFFTINYYFLLPVQHLYL